MNPEYSMSTLNVYLSSVLSLSLSSPSSPTFYNKEYDIKSDILEEQFPHLLPRFCL